MKEFGWIPTGVRVPLENNRRHLSAGFVSIKAHAFSIPPGQQPADRGGHQWDAMPSRIYCRGLRRVEEGGDDEGPERLGAPYSSGTSAARDTSSGRLLSS